MTDNNASEMAVRNVERVGDLLIDEATGEILEWPADVAVDRWEWLGRQAAEARAQENAWKAAGGFYRRLLLGHLDAEQLDRFVGETVRFGRRNGRDNRVGDPAKLDAVREQFELTRTHLKHIRGTANRYNRKDLDALEKRGQLPEGVTEALTSGRIGDAYAQVDLVRKEAPVVEKNIRVVDGGEEA
jgi:hypothetical protein